MKKKINFKYKKKIFSNAILYKLLMTLDIFFFVFCLTLIALYIIGNFQNFLDKSQQIILNILSISSIFTALLSIILFIETIIKIFTEKSKIRNIFNLLYLLLTLVCCAVFIIISTTINYISLGV